MGARQAAALLVAIWGLLLGLNGPAAAATQVAVLDIQGPIGPGTVNYVERAFGNALERGAGAIVLRIDTPGGLISAMRGVVEEILALPVPVIGYVAPSGAHAASAGTFILFACHVAAMAPGTNLGAATPVRLGGDGLPIDPRRSLPGMDDKLVNDAAAFLRALAELRGRDPAWAEQAVRQASSLAAGEAYRRGIVDLIAPNLEQLLARLDGRSVVINDVPQRLAMRDRTLITYEPGWQSELLELLTNPTMAYVLLLIGLYGVMFELFNPGTIATGVIGVICLLLAFYAFRVLPINYIGLGLILLGLLLMTMELLVPSFGAIGISGVITFVAGSVLLIDTGVPGYRVSWQLIGGLGTFGSSLILLTLLALQRSRTRPAVTGEEAMLGISAEVLHWEGDSGRIRLQGEIWTARGPSGLLAGQRVRVTGIDGLMIDVEPDEA